MMTVGGNNTTVPPQQQPPTQQPQQPPPHNVVIPQQPPRRPRPEDAASHITVGISVGVISGVEEIYDGIIQVTLCCKNLLNLFKS